MMQTHRRTHPAHLRYAKKAHKYLDQSVKLADGGASTVDGLFGKAFLFSREKKPSDALERYNTILSLFPDYMSVTHCFVSALP
jgi:hypothetical protein